MITHLQVLDALRKAGHTTSEVNSVMRRLAAKELRDEFAMVALSGVLANGQRSFSSPEAASSEAYRIADAMMKARDK
jgi:hypothetical protein